MKILILTLFLSTHGMCLTNPSQATLSKVESSLANTTLRVTGRIVPKDGSVFIESARFVGRVISLLAKEGDHIHKGKALLLINSAECLSLYQEKKIAKERQLDDVMATIKNREHQLGLKVEADSCYLVSSSEGVISKKLVESGSNFNIGDNLFTIINKKDLTVELEVPERDANKIRVGQKVKVQRSSDPDQEYTSKISSIVPSLSSVSRTIRARLDPIQFKNNPTIDELVFAEIYVDVKGVVYKVPAKSVVFSKGQDFVLKTVDKKIAQVAVRVLNQNSDSIFLQPMTDGQIKQDDMVVSEGAVFQMQKMTQDE